MGFMVSNEVKFFYFLFFSFNLNFQLLFFFYFLFIFVHVLFLIHFFYIEINVRKIPRCFSIKDWLCCNPFCIINDLRTNYVMDLSFGSVVDLSLSTSILFPSIMPCGLSKECVMFYQSKITFL